MSSPSPTTFPLFSPLATDSDQQARYRSCYSKTGVWTKALSLEGPTLLGGTELPAKSSLLPLYSVQISLHLYKAGSKSVRMDLAQRKVILGPILLRLYWTVAGDPWTVRASASPGQPTTSLYTRTLRAIVGNWFQYSPPLKSHQ